MAVVMTVMWIWYGQEEGNGPCRKMIRGRKILGGKALAVLFTPACQESGEWDRRIGI